MLGLAGDLKLQHRLSEHFLQPGAFAFRLIQALGIRQTHPVELAAPEVVTSVREALPTAQLLDRQFGLGFVQKANDLLFSGTLLHVQSLGCWNWNLKLGATQIGRGVART